MRFILLFFLLIRLTAGVLAQPSDTLSIDRELYTRVLPDSLSQRISEIQSYSDSLSGKKSKKYVLKLDSLAGAQNTTGDLNVSVYAWERLYNWYHKTSNIKSRDVVAGKLFSAWNSGNLKNEIELNLTDKLISLFEQKGDFEKLYFLSSGKMAGRMQAQSDTILSLQSEVSELKKDLSENESRLINASNSNRELNQLLIGLAAGAAFILLWLFWLLVRNSKIKKKLKSALKTESNTEAEVLAGKLSASEREKEQLKEIASVGIKMLNELDATINNALSILNKTTEELEMTIQESTNLTETSRKELPVALYMSQKNLLHRMGNQVVEGLKSCSDTLKKSIK